MVKRMIENTDPIHPVRVDGMCDEVKVTCTVPPLGKQMFTFDERYGILVTYLDIDNQPLKLPQDTAKISGKGWMYQAE